MEPNMPDRISLSRGDWVEAVERLRETIDADEIYVIARPIGTTLCAISSLPQVDEQQIRFALRPQSSQGHFPLEMSVLLPLLETDVEFETVLFPTGHTCFLVSIWIDGLARDDFQTRLCFSANLEALTRAATEFLQD